MPLGLDFEYFSKGDTKVDGKTIGDSDSNYMNLMPIVGYPLSSDTNTINITDGYLLHINGKNFPKFNCFLISTLIFL